MGGKDSPQPQYANVTTLQTSWDVRSKLLKQKSSPPITYVPKSTSSINLDMKIHRGPLHPQRRSLRRAPLELSRSTASERKDSTTSTTSSQMQTNGTARTDSSSPIRQYMECIEPRTLCCAIVGDSGVGKTSLLLSYTTGKISETHEPTIYDKFSSKHPTFSKRAILHI